jgi:hypothetical protein
MGTSSRHRWPFSPRVSMVMAVTILIILIGLLAVTRRWTNWPSPAAERYVLTGIFVVSLMPLLPMLIDVLAGRGATLEYKGLKLAFARISEVRASVALIPTNIGVRGQAVTDSDSKQILTALEQAVGNEIVVLDLEDGHAWWETRLLVLLAGAVRQGRPRAVVFMATEEGKTDRFQGWGHPDDLLRALLRVDAGYRKVYHTVRAAAGQWQLIEPGSPGVPQGAPAWLTGLANQYLQLMAFDQTLGLPNEFAAEQLLASELGRQFETPPPPKEISIVRLKELFAPVLRMHSVDQNSSPNEQLRDFARDDGDYVAVTKDGQYVLLARRLAIVSAMVQSQVEAG